MVDFPASYVSFPGFFTCPLFKGTNLSVGNTSIFQPTIGTKRRGANLKLHLCDLLTSGFFLAIQNASFLEPRWLFLPQCWDILWSIHLYIYKQIQTGVVAVVFPCFICLLNVQQKKRSPQSVVGNYHARKLSFFNETIHKSGSLKSMYKILLLQASPPPKKKKTNEFSVFGSVFSWIWNPFFGEGTFVVSPKEWFLKTWISGPSDTALKWFTSWWFQPRWRILVKLDHFPR